MTNETKNIPLHVSLIMDGNGRWAKERGKERVYGHFEGVSSVRACVEAAVENGVRYLSLFAFSEENWNRPDDEVTTLMGLMVKAMADEMFAHLTDATYALIGHELAATQKLTAGMFSTASVAAMPDLTARVKAFAANV